jgi:hypothetical protein
MSEPKVTECFTKATDTGFPSMKVDPIKWTSRADACSILWREDYDAMRKELEELRAFVKQLGDYAAYGEFGKKRLGVAEREEEK